MSCFLGIETNCDECRMCKDKREEKQASTETVKERNVGKSILMIDTVEACCYCLFSGLEGEYCCIKDKPISEKEYLGKKPDWCPIKKLPDKIEVSGDVPQEDGITPSYKIGWNACIDAILKECDKDVNTTN